MNKKLTHSVFEKISTIHPKRIAIESGEHKISYHKLNQQANSIAHQLLKRTEQEKKVVAVLLPAGIPYAASLLGVFKAGKMLMPLDLSFPEERLRSLIQRTQPSTLIIDQKNSERVIGILKSINYLDQLECLLEVQEDGQWVLRNPHDGNTAALPLSAKVVSNPSLQISPEDSNYILFTSGSTGVPKAIEGCHKSLSHFIHWEIKEFNLNQPCRVSFIAPPTFDVSFRDILVPLLSGGTLCIPTPAIRENAAKLLDWVDESKITLMHCVPSIFRLFLQDLESSSQVKEKLPALKYILLAGEALYGNDVNRWKAIYGERTELVNLYGPSESTLAKAFYRIPPGEQEDNRIIPLGKPISNTELLILKEGELCRPGVMGEIHIMTPFLSKGYFGDPELFQKNLAQNSFNPSVPLYRTGDMGRYLSDRNIEFIGRLDNQVKVNGIRIEPAEIEQSLLKHAAIQQAVVTTHRNQREEISLAAYYLSSEGLSTSKARKFLESLLPQNHIPAYFLLLDEFPLNLNGKVDRKALPKPIELLYDRIPFKAASTNLETALANQWKEELSLQKVGILNPFFELGGDSLKATRLVLWIYRELGYQVSLAEFLEHNTIQKLAAYLSIKTPVGYQSIRMDQKAI